MNLRKLITRNITYTIVTVKYNDDFWNDEYLVYGTTSAKAELKKILRKEETPSNDVPTVTTKTVTEKRAITIDNFINYSIKINE